MGIKGGKNLIFHASDRIVELGRTVVPVCLPFRPIDDTDYLINQFVNSAGYRGSGSPSSANGRLSISNLNVRTFPDLLITFFLMASKFSHDEESPQIFINLLTLRLRPTQFLLR